MDKKTENTAAVVALVCGILSIVLSIWAWVNFVAIALGIVGIVFGVKGRKIEDKKGMATAGMVCGIVGLVLACTCGMCSTCAACALKETSDALNSVTQSDVNNWLNSLK